MPTWETLSASVEVPRSRLAPALALLAEMVAEPAFPGDEVERLRDERLNDLMQAWADPRRRAERVFPGDDLRRRHALQPAARRHPRRLSARSIATRSPHATRSCSTRRRRRSSSPAI